MAKRVGLYWFVNDLRLTDQPLLAQAAQQVDELICLFCYPKMDAFLLKFSEETEWSRPKQQFLDECLMDLSAGLKALGQSLLVTELDPATAIAQLVEEAGVTQVYADAFPGSYEQQVIGTLAKKYPQLKMVQEEVRSFFKAGDLPFAIDVLPETFSKFRKLVEKLPIRPISPKISQLPPSPADLLLVNRPLQSRSDAFLFIGGEVAAWQHLKHYFSTTWPSSYKVTRNGLDGMAYSTKFSPWLAHGCISPQSILAQLKAYETANGANESTYWIFFELLWREYFYWYGRRFQKRLFLFEGIHQQSPPTVYDAENFRAWKNGETAYPIVNACMHQLRQTGYMSNRGRQLVASCLVHELNMDWRYGAAYFESQLVDYDVSSNWGNWQYLAGVGADPRGWRQFNLQKQAETYDPAGEFVQKWGSGL